MQLKPAFANRNTLYSITSQYALCFEAEVSGIIATKRDEA
jgi:hypothetical protein